MGKRIGWLLVLFCAASPARAHLLPRPFALDRFNRQIRGRVLDYSRNHDRDRRLYFPSLGEKRDMYVYLPPGYDPCKRYPMGIFLHGFLSDEKSFLEYVIEPLDRAIARGTMPPVVVLAPDASARGVDCFASYGTFYVNSKLGRFEDYIVCDVYDWAMKTFALRPEPEAHCLIGVSMGGYGAFSKAMKHPDKFRVAVGVLPPLNMLWSSCRGRYRDDFDPNCWRQRESVGRPREVVGRFYGVFVVRQGKLIRPLFGRNNPDAIEMIKADNPFDLLDSRDVRPGQFEFFVGYAGRDEFNLDAQAESFLYRARERQIPVTVRYLPDGRHNSETGRKFLPDVLRWLGDRLAPFHPGAVGR